MFSWALFNLIILVGFAGNYKILAMAILANLIALVEHRARREHEEVETAAVVASVKRLTTRKYRKDL